jgi:ATP-dependent RNA helicase DeaD
LQSGEAASKPNTEQYERPEREERPQRGGFRDDRRERYDDRGPRFERRERVEDRPRRFEDRPPRAGAPIPITPRAAKLTASGAPVSDPARSKTAPLPRAGSETGAPAAKPAEASEGRLANTSKPPVETKPAAEKTYSDEEILASVKAPESAVRKPVGPKSTPPWASKRREDSKPAAGSKPSRATPPNQTRLWMNLGEAQAIKPIDIVNAVAGETGLPGKVVGTVDVRERHLFVDVAAEHAHGIIAKLNRAQIKGHKVKVKVA